MLVDGAAPVRHHNTTHPASWQQLAALFAEGDTRVQSDPWAIHRPDTPRDSFGGADEHVDLIICSGLNIVIDPRAAWRPLREQDVDQLADALNRSDWSASHRLDFRWWRLQHSQVPPPRTQPVPHDQAASGRDYRRAGSQPTRFPSKLLSAEMPGGYGQTATHLLVHLDVIIRIPPLRGGRPRPAHGAVPGRVPPLHG